MVRVGNNDYFWSIVSRNDKNFDYRKCYRRLSKMLSATIKKFLNTNSDKWRYKNGHKKSNNCGGTKGTGKTAKSAGKKKNKPQNLGQRDAWKPKNVIIKPTSSTDKVGGNVEGKITQKTTK